MYQYTQRIIQPTIRMPVQNQQSIIIPLDKSSQLQSTRRVSQNIDQQNSNVSPIRLIKNKVSVSPNVIKYSQQPQTSTMTPQKIPYNQRQTQTPTKHQDVQSRTLQSRTHTPNVLSQQRQSSSNNQYIQSNRIHTDTGFSTPLHNQREKENNEYSNDKLTTQYQNLQEQLIQSEFKISQLEQKSRKLQEQRKKLQQQFLQKSPKLASQL
ncbi:unnamed protein product [Paramecium pentaurelia]|uniref:Uncharacterized protein n=1 Tax=Paramecium pentaurelia TaxID=43138 RepID=A0A8S1UUV6_9CILI|nr:unnamed protein product [Paramecium pentaurelia]